MSYHNPVLLQETVAGLNIKPDGVYVDVTFGGGGHSREILKHLGPEGKLYAFDQDPDAQANVVDDDRFVLIPENFRYVKRFLRFQGVREVDGVLGDFGVSSHQFDVAERGFSTRYDADLDMRMDTTAKKSAYTVINKYDEGELRQMFYEYGELRMAPKLAREIVAVRKETPIKTGEQLKAIAEPFMSQSKRNKLLAMIYQAIRIEVNEEIDVLKDFLMQMQEIVKVGGRISLISYHSLEDRLVKRYIRSGMFKGEPEKDMFGRFEVPFKKVGGLIVPGQEEIKLNSRARSAKLRIAERLV